jgi:hypothetical protein
MRRRQGHRAKYREASGWREEDRNFRLGKSCYELGLRTRWISDEYIRESMDEGLRDAEYTAILGCGGRGGSKQGNRQERGRGTAQLVDR